MSVITPLLDTLLHEVLGKRMDAPAKRDLNQPVKPTVSTDAPLAVRSDSRLDARRPLLPQPLSGASRRGAEGAKASPTLPQGTPSAPASQTSLSPAARSIGNILARYPAPPSVVRSPAPLVPNQQPSGEVSSLRLGEALRTSISESGLFYESHLKAWYRGDLTTQQLIREPQMRAARELANLPPAQAGSRGASGEATASRGSSASSPPPLTPSPRYPGAAQEAATNKSGALPSRPEAQSQQPAAGLGDTRVLESSEQLQGLVRHQLELLATPVLRWEGDVWSGIFMSLMIHLAEVPVAQRNADDADPGEDEQPEEQQGQWQSELKLDVQGLGRLHVGLRLRDDMLDLNLRVASPVVLEKLEAGRQSLSDRLRNCGFDSPQISMTLQEAEPDD